MLALRGINVKGFIISTRNVWTIYNKGLITTTTTTTKALANCAQGQRGKWPALAMQKTNDNDNSNEQLCRWQFQHKRNFSKKKILKLPYLINMQKYEMCMQTPPAQKPLIVEASKSTECESTTKHDACVDTPSPTPSTTKSTSDSSECTSSSSSSTTKSSNNDQKKSTDTLQMPEIKFPSREQLEKYFYRAIVITWDLGAYLCAVAMKLIDQYILQNPTFKEHWGVIVQKLENARKELKK